VSITEEDEATWSDLINEARRFVSGP